MYIQLPHYHKIPHMINFNKWDRLNTNDTTKVSSMGHNHFLAHTEVYHRRVNLRVISAYTNHTYIHTVLVHTHMHIDGLAFDSKEV